MRGVQTRALVLTLTLPLLAACGAAPPAAPATRLAPAPAPAPAAGLDEPVPTLRLPRDVRPVAEAIELHVDPDQARFSGAVDIDVVLDRPRALLWLHGKDLQISRAYVQPAGQAPVAATWQQRHESGVASLTLASAVPAGKARVHVDFDAAFLHGQEGLYVAGESGRRYAFTQFEAIAARDAFPCFDEPAFKIPFTTTLVVPAGAQAVANTPEVSRTPEGGSVRVAFAPTAPLPSYLVAFAVGPLDVVAAPDVPPNAVRSRPLPLRGMTAQGRGKEIAYALAHTGELVAELEKYTGIAYPWDKLDIIAVPGKGGAMENAGAITFGEPLLLMDEATASVSQRRRYAGVMAHELAHQWTGDLVTMQWWDDTWLNEAFATWLAPKIADAWDPKLHADVGALRGAEYAMTVDGLVSAREIRQPIASADDIENAFDAITYQKGGAVLAMFERWAGADAWQKGLHAYLEKHRFGNATADDFLDAENEATGKDVKTAFHTFLDQVGVPLVEVRTSCEGGKEQVHLAQSRYLPLGSTGDAHETWQVPVCVRAEGRGQQCTLLVQAEQTMVLEGAGADEKAKARAGAAAAARCPGWIFPNADAAGYYRFALAPADLTALRRRGLPALSTREKIAYASSLRAAYARGATSFADALDASAPLAKEADPAVADEPMGYYEQARDWLYGDPLRPNVERAARRLYAPVGARLGWSARKGEDDETRTLRTAVVDFLALDARDPGVRAEAKRRGLAYIRGGAVHPEAVDPNLAGIALAVVGEEADRATWDAMKALFAASVDETARGRLLYAMSVARDPTLAAAAREMTLDPSLRGTEVLTALRVQLRRPETRDAAWSWLREHYDAIVPRVSLHRRAAALISLGGVFCDDAKAKEVEAFFGPKARELDGGPRVLASTLETVQLCAAKRKVQEPSARKAFAK